MGCFVCQRLMSSFCLAIDVHAFWKSSVVKKNGAVGHDPMPEPLTHA